MSAEYKIYCILTEKYTKEIQELLTRHPYFSQSVTVEQNVFFEFRVKQSSYEMPDFSVVIKKDCLYILNNQSAEAWGDIGFIQQYLRENNVQYTIEEL